MSSLNDTSVQPALKTYGKQRNRPITARSLATIEKNNAYKITNKHKNWIRSELTVAGIKPHTRNSLSLDSIFTQIAEKFKLDPKNSKHNCSVKNIHDVYLEFTESIANLKIAADSQKAAKETFKIDQSLRAAIAAETERNDSIAVVAITRERDELIQTSIAWTDEVGCSKLIVFCC